MGQVLHRGATTTEAIRRERGGTSLQDGERRLAPSPKLRVFALWRTVVPSRPQESHFENLRRNRSRIAALGQSAE